MPRTIRLMKDDMDDALEGLPGGFKLWLLIATAKRRIQTGAILQSLVGQDSVN